jgi:hypothetical protein
MKACRLAIIPCLTMLLAADAWGGGPVIDHLYPAGGRRGTTFEVEVSCAVLRGLKGDVAVRVSGGGVTAAVVPLVKEDRRTWQTRLAELKKGEKTPAILREIDDLELKSAIAEGKRFQGIKDPGMPQVARMTVTIAPDAEPGLRELRLETSEGPSNPLTFHVGELPEFIETDVTWNLPAIVKKVADGQLPPGQRLFTGDLVRAGQIPPPLVSLPATINGQIFPAEMDRYRFQATKGQKLVISAIARELKPFLAAGSPGSIELDLTLHSDQGRQVAHSDHHLFYHDPVILYEVPADGNYVLAVKDAIHRGRFDFVYRISIGEQPFITSRFPLGGRAGEATTVSVAGWNLPAAMLTMDGRKAGIHPLFVRNKLGMSNRLPFVVDALPECVEKEGNNDIAAAQNLTLPVIVNGRIDSPGDVDVFRFKGRAGEKIVAEVYARRLESAMDSLLVLTDAAGKRLAFNDDTPDSGAGRLTHQADSWLMAVLPADGTYYVHTRDTQDKGGPAHAYRLRIGPPQPDFDLRVFPSNILARPGGNVPITARVIRRDGFAGDVALGLRDAPRGCRLGQGYVSPKHPELIRLSLWAPPKPLETSVNIVLEGRAAVQGHEIIHPAVPADEMEQAFGGSWHIVPAQEFLVAVREKELPVPPPSTAPAATLPAAPASQPGPPPVPWAILGATPLAIPIEGSVRLRARAPADITVGTEFGLREPPPGITMRTVAMKGRDVEFEFESDPAAGSRPGVGGDLVIAIYPPSVSSRRRSKGVLPPIPFEIVVPSAKPR